MCETERKRIREREFERHRDCASQTDSAFTRKTYSNSEKKAASIASVDKSLEPAIAPNVRCLCGTVVNIINNLVIIGNQYSSTAVKLIELYNIEKVLH